MEWKIPLFRIYWDKDDIEYIERAIKRGMSWTIGPEVTELEQALAEYHQVKYCLTFNSGTSALHATMLACGIGPGDEVIVPSFTFIATANAPLFVGARPVFADIEEKTLGLDPADVEKKITAKTKAIIPIHYGGCPCLIDELREVARRRDILLIEDAAEAQGAKVKGKKAGALGDIGILSFCQNKTMTTGEGGAVTTNSRDIYEKLKLVRSQGRLETADYFTSAENMDYIRLGYNFRLSNILAALGLAQLKKLDKMVEMRRENAFLLNEKLAGIKDVKVPVALKDDYHTYQMYTVIIPASARNGLMQHLAKAGIMSKIFFNPVHKTHFYKNELKYKVRLPVTEAVSARVLTLPMCPALTGEEIDLISGEIRGYLSRGK